MIRQIFDILSSLSGTFLEGLIQVTAIALGALLVLALTLRLVAWILGSVGAIAVAWNRLRATRAYRITRDEGDRMEGEIAGRYQNR